MATWQADVDVNSSVGRIRTEVEASTPQGAEQQIRAKHGNVQQIVNLQKVKKSSGDDTRSVEESVGLVALIGFAWVFYAFLPWALMGLGGAAGAWIGEKVTGLSVDDYNNDPSDKNRKKAAAIVALSLVLGGVGFVKGDQIKKGFDAPTDTPAQVQLKK